MNLILRVAVFAMGLSVFSPVDTLAAGPRFAESFDVEPLAIESLDCLIVPGEIVQIGSSTTGLLSNVPVGRGDIVTKGQVIAELESGVERAGVALSQERSDSKAEVDRTTARLVFQSRQETRLRELYENKTVSRESLDKVEIERVIAEHAVREAKVNHRLAELDLVRSKEMLKQRTIVSPIAGVVMERELYVGEYVNETSHIMEIAQIDPLNVEVFVPLEMYDRVVVGTPATVMLKEPLTGSFQAETVIVDYVMDAGSSTFGVRLRLDNPDHTIPTGVKCQLIFAIDSSGEREVQRE